MKFVKTLVALGLVLSFGWMYFYALPTASLVQQILNNEPYYVDIVPMYLLPYAIAPFVAAGYIEGYKQHSLNGTFQLKQLFNFALIAFFALLQLFESLAFFFAFFQPSQPLNLKLSGFCYLCQLAFLFFLFCLLVSCSKHDIV